MRMRIAVAVAVLAALLGTVAAPAQAAECCGTIAGQGKTEVMGVSVRGNTASLVIDYTLYKDLSGTAQAGQWALTFDGATYRTSPNFSADRMWVDYEKSPGNWVAIAHYGGDGSPQNTVTPDFNIPSKGDFFVSNPTDGPAFRFRVQGFENSTTDVRYDYGNI